jgi:hypothetical protein
VSFFWDNENIVALSSFNICTSLKILKSIAKLYASKVVNIKLHELYFNKAVILKNPWWKIVAVVSGIPRWLGQGLISHMLAITGFKFSPVCCDMEAPAGSTQGKCF